MKALHFWSSNLWCVEAAFRPVLDSRSVLVRLTRCPKSNGVGIKGWPVELIN